jgi:hypothetical protein
VNELLDALRPRFSFLGGVNSVENRVAVAAVRRGEEGLRNSIRRAESSLQR